jgi:LAO/AO transport system kinase
MENAALKPDALAELRSGGKPALAAALAMIEQAPDSEAAVRLLEQAYAAPLGFVLGLTGPPGVGKSTLASALLRRWRSAGETVGVIAVDPSSQRTGGALLGDRVRMRTDPGDGGVFVRSLAARGRLGGLAELAFPAVILMRALFSRVMVESVGVGQSEAEIANVTDRVVLCIQPGSGDSLQFMKAGIMEIPDVAVVTKADMGAAARRALADLKGALGLAVGAEIPCLAVSASTGEGMDALMPELSPPADLREIAARRHTQARNWLRAAIVQRFGSAGLVAAGDALSLPSGRAPFAAAKAITSAMQVRYEPPA